jgi:hypothetical protein
MQPDGDRQQAPALLQPALRHRRRPIMAVGRARALVGVTTGTSTKVVWRGPGR